MATSKKRFKYELIEDVQKIVLLHPCCILDFYVNLIEFKPHFKYKGSCLQFLHFHCLHKSSSFLFNAFILQKELGILLMSFKVFVIKVSIIDVSINIKLS